VAQILSFAPLPNQLGFRLIVIDDHFNPNLFGVGITNIIEIFYENN